MMYIPTSTTLPEASQVLPPSNPVHPPEANGGGVVEPAVGGGQSASGARVSWAGGRISTSDKGATLAAFVARKCAKQLELTQAVSRRVAEQQLAVPANVILPVGWQRDSGDGCVYPTLADACDSDDEPVLSLERLRATVTPRTRTAQRAGALSGGEPALEHDLLHDILTGGAGDEGLEGGAGGVDGGERVRTAPTRPVFAVSYSPKSNRPPFRALRRAPAQCEWTASPCSTWSRRLGLCCWR